MMVISLNKRFVQNVLNLIVTSVDVVSTFMRYTIYITKKKNCNKLTFKYFKLIKINLISTDKLFKFDDKKIFKLTFEH